MAKHTPGPWEVRSPKNDNNAFDVFPVGNPHVKLHHGYWGGEADARLIAAAPELLEAVKKLDWHIRNPGRKESHGQVCETDPCDLCFARAAIAKAEGR